MSNPLRTENLVHVNGMSNQSPTSLSDLGSITESENGNSALSTLPAITLLDLTVERLQQDQDLDLALQPIRHYLTGELPKSQQLARAILVQQSDFVVVDCI